MRTYCYMRVSTERQEHDAQRVRLQEYAARAGYHPIEWIEEKRSGAKSLPLRDALLARARRTPIRLVAWKLDRLGRSMVDVVMFCDAIQRTGSELVLVELGFDTSTPIGRCMAHVLGACAELERSSIIERTNAGLDHARRHGTRSGKAIGRPRVVLSELEVAGALQRAEDRVCAPERSRRVQVLRVAARELRCSARTLQRWLQGPRQNPLARFAPQGLENTSGGGGE